MWSTTWSTTTSKSNYYGFRIPILLNFFYLGPVFWWEKRLKGAADDTVGSTGLVWNSY